MTNKANRYFVFKNGAVIDLDRIICILANNGKIWGIRFNGIESPVTFEPHEIEYDQQDELTKALIAYGNN